MSNVGVDLLRSDTGHYMQWPAADGAPLAASTGTTSTGTTSSATRRASRGRTWILALGGNAAATAAPDARAHDAAVGERRAWAAPARSSGPIGVTLTLVNWLFLLLLFCTFLLAKTLPSADAALTGGSATSACAQQSAGCGSTFGAGR